MMATAFEIVDRRHGRPHLGDMESLLLRETGALPDGEILENPHITLFTLSRPFDTRLTDERQQKQAAAEASRSRLCLQRQPWPAGIDCVR
jgi:hypothetical protein